MRPNRPRVALIGFEADEDDALGALCGDPRAAWTWSDYCEVYSVNETDLAVARGWDVKERGVPCHLMAISPVSLGKSSVKRTSGSAIQVSSLTTRWDNTERELSVPEQCPARYKELATELARNLASLENAPPTLSRRAEFTDAQVLVQTTSGQAVALRAEVTREKSPMREEGPVRVVLVLPDDVEPVPWFRAFLADVHEMDRESVPHPPPRLASPEDWFTPDERRVAERLQAITAERDQLAQEEKDLNAELATQAENADAGPRLAIWEDGDELVSAVEDILRQFGFDVRNMDSETPDGAPKREDLRLTHPDLEDWEALVEVKGYSGGTRTKDAQQIQRYRMEYAKEQSRDPDLTLWIANPHRHSDPSARPGPDGNVRTQSENIDTVHVLTTDLYRLWSMVADDQLDSANVVRELSAAAPGIWEPSALP